MQHSKQPPPTHKKKGTDRISHAETGIIRVFIQVDM